MILALGAAFARCERSCVCDRAVYVSVGLTHQVRLVVVAAPCISVLAAALRDTRVVSQLACGSSLFSSPPWHVAQI